MKPGEIRYFRMSRAEREKLIKALKNALEGEEHVVFAILHGSFLSRELFRDVDVAVWLDDVKLSFYYTVDFSAKLEVELGVPVDIQVLNEAPLPFRYIVLSRGKVLFSRDESLRLKLLDLASREYFDLKQLREALQAQL